jgi:uncharacterized protein
LHTPIKIIAGDLLLDGELFDSPCASAVAGVLPLDVRASRWGDEFYFEIPVKYPADDTATRSVKIGDIGFWPPGSALALFFGPTPISTGPDPVPASDINLVGRITDDATALGRAENTAHIRIERRERRGGSL